MKTCTNVPSSFGRYIAIAEYLLFDRQTGLSRSRILSQAMIQPNYFFVDTIKKIHAGNGQRGEWRKTPEGVKRYKDINALLSSIVDSFPSEGLPARFALSEQSIIMINYNQQKSKLYETIEKEDTRGL
ncbi:hypothetical protein AALM74_04775 [Parabacteroides segnis]|uniref:hypothetical protein n=1 Tax=Parabacteroides segnis TaxID=2763058 RepID=UPI0035175E8D